jgi:adenine-specific DNA-methyltransferase
MTAVSLIDKADEMLANKLLNALAVQFLRDSRRLGLDPGENWIACLCRELLTPSESDTDYFATWQLRESDLFDVYRAENHDVVDYLHLVSLELRKQLGQFVTPSAIVKHILRSVGYEPTAEILDYQLIDPACGSGVFLVEALRLYLQALQHARVPIAEWYPRAVHALVGLDIDPKACLFARFNLAMTLSPAIIYWATEHGYAKPPRLPIYHADTLQTFADEMAGSRLFDYTRQCPVRLVGQFDFVVGNPPYHKIPRMTEALRQIFAESLYGHPNAYGLFLHAGIEMLADGGRLGFIIPRSILSGLYFQNLRRFVQHHAALREIISIADRRNIFENVLQGTMVLSLAKRPVLAENVVVTCIDELRDLEQAPSATVVEQRIAQRLNGLTIWFVDNSLRTYDILERIIGAHPLLSGPEIQCPARTGQIVWNRVKPLLSNENGRSTRPLIWATDVGRFNFTFNAAGPSRPCYLQVNSKTEHLMVRGPSLLIQRVTADEQPHRIVACSPESFCEHYGESYFIENHLNFIQLPTKPRVDLFYLLGLLNSQIVEFFFRAMNGNTQVSATELNLLPVLSGRLDQQIAELSRRIQATKPADTQRILEDELNHAVASAYELTTDELAFVRSWLSARRREVVK